jgi:exportin-2 (importin alpha re-exporter)
MRFLSTTIKGGQYKELYNNKESLRTLIGSIVVPSVQLRGTLQSINSPCQSLTHSIEHDIEQFEDDPLEFIRIDLSFPTSSAGTASFSSTGGGEGTTRRHAAADVIRSLVSSGHDADTTELVGEWVQDGLQHYVSNPAENWKAKDSAVFLMSAVAARGSVTAV